MIERFLRVSPVLDTFIIDPTLAEVFLVDMSNLPTYYDLNSSIPWKILILKPAGLPEVYPRILELLLPTYSSPGSFNGYAVYPVFKYGSDEIRKSYGYPFSHYRGLNVFGLVLGGDEPVITRMGGNMK